MSTNPTTPSQAVDRQILHVAVAQRLRTMIMEGDLAPGTRLNERVLCDLLQVSRTPLREAFKVLAGDGLVTLLPNRGAEVVVLSQEAINHLFEMMGALEAMSGELACQRITDAELNEIRALHYEMLACHARRDLPNYYALNRRIMTRSMRRRAIRSRGDLSTHQPAHSGAALPLELRSGQMGHGRARARRDARCLVEARWGRAA